jgi:hypothetical protein
MPENEWSTIANSRQPSDRLEGDPPHQVKGPDRVDERMKR